MDKNEKEAILHLIKEHCDISSTWNIIDVGCNKGTWTDILLDYKDSSQYPGTYNIHLFDANEMLLTYLKVKYDYKENITYCDRACYKEEGKKTFYYFDDYHNGLSSLYDNDRWKQELGQVRKQKEVQTITLDRYWMEVSVGSFLQALDGGKQEIQQKIDFLKIDVEGAEYDVLLGCKNLLANKLINFIQVEYSEHYKVSGHTFEQIIDLAHQNGYKVWNFTGTEFIEVSKQEWNENYQAANYILSHLPIGRYHYTQLWNNEFVKNTEFLKGKINLALEIGSFEGLTSNYICDHLLNKQIGGRLICIDPLEDMYLSNADKQTNDMFIGQYDRFIKNTKDQPIELIRKRSSEESVWEYLNQYLVDFAYIDGDHSEAAVLQDGINVFNILRIGGYIVFDDYEWREETKRGIDKFLEIYKEKLQIIFKNYQVGIRKLRN